MARVSSPVSMAPSSTRTRSISQYWCNATRCTATPSSARSRTTTAAGQNRRIEKWKPPLSQFRPDGKESNDEPHREEVGQPLAYEGADEGRSEEHTSELQSRQYLVCRLLLEKKKNNQSKASPTYNACTPLQCDRVQHSL